MKTATLTQERLSELLAQFPTCRIAVVGDFFLDKYLEIEPAWEEISLETGKPAHQVSAIRTSPGEAGTVVANLHALGAGEIHAVGFTGDDGEGFELRRDLQQLGCRIDQLQILGDRFTPTYLKPCNLTQPGLEGEHSRYDTKNRLPTSPAVEDRVIQSIEQLATSVDAVIALDQVEEKDCGVVTKKVRDAISKLALQFPHVCFWADSRRNIRRFRHVFIKPNQLEALEMESLESVSLEIDQLLQPIRAISRTNLGPVFLTRGQEGLVVVDGEEEAVSIPGVCLEGPTDPTGAGDSMTAGCVLSLCSGASKAEAAIIGNLVASLTVQQLATTGTAASHQLSERLELWLSQTTSSP
ncbi:MAG: carbohydrate kinase [Planctomycetaceae bacterium]|nr:carbohydrate kinase [Planctomycetaceae bacterium]